MNDLELKRHLQETCPVRPGQESRAWEALRTRLQKPVKERAWLFFPTWRSLAFTCLAILLMPAVFDLGLNMRPVRHGLVFADSQTPGIEATTFYSSKAQAQVVWLKGMDPATDQPTYMDHTSVIHAKTGLNADSL